MFNVKELCAQTFRSPMVTTKPREEPHMPHEHRIKTKEMNIGMQEDLEN